MLKCTPETAGHPMLSACFRIAAPRLGYAAADSRLSMRLGLAPDSLGKASWTHSGSSACAAPAAPGSRCAFSSMHRLAAGMGDGPTSAFVVAGHFHTATPCSLRNGSLFLETEFMFFPKNAWNSVLNGAQYELERRGVRQIRQTLRDEPLAGVRVRPVRGYGQPCPPVYRGQDDLRQAV